jgi:hypothetical protein
VTIGDLQVRRPLGRPMHRWGDIIKMEVKEKE